MTTTMQLIAKQTVGSGGASSVTFSNIPQTFTDLKVVASVRATTNNWIQAINLTFNSSRTTNQIRLYAIGSSVASDTSVGSGQGEFGWAAGNTATSNTFSNGEIYIPNYRSTTAKSYFNDSTVENNSTSNNLLALIASLNTSVTIAINSITIEPSADSFAEFSTFYLYGISNDTTTQNPTSPYASGGDIISTDGTYWYHTFLYSGTFTPLKNLTCDLLLVAGGAGGGGSDSAGLTAGGGGGAGGYLEQTGRSIISNTAYPVVIGAGGAQGVSAPSQTPALVTAGSNGGNSTFDTITAIGGGGGHAGGANTGTQFDAKTGGSGGGGTATGGGSNTNGAAGNQGNSGGATGYGNAGGNGTTGGTGSYQAGAGGGGAGGAGANSLSSSTSTGGSGGAGGAGKQSSITGTATYYAAGGSGANEGTTNTGSTNSIGGAGGKGTGGVTNPTAGAVNTGSGGGGSAYQGTGGNGGSGIFIVRYAV